MPVSIFALDHKTNDQSELQKLMDMFLSCLTVPLFLILLSSTAIIGQEIPIYQVVGVPLISLLILWSAVLIIEYRASDRFTDIPESTLYSTIIGLELGIILLTIVLSEHILLAEARVMGRTYTANMLQYLYAYTFIASSVPTGFLIGRLQKRNPYIFSILLTLASIVAIQTLLSI